MNRVTASDRLKRLLALLPWVAAHEGPTVEQVCDRFALSTEDLLSDVALVSMVGIPPYSPGDLFDIVVEGGRVWVHLQPSFDRALRLTPEEALGLVAAGASLLAVPGADPNGPLARGIAKVAAGVTSSLPRRERPWRGLIPPGSRSETPATRRRPAVRKSS